MPSQKPISAETAELTLARAEFSATMGKHFPQHSLVSRNGIYLNAFTYSMFQGFLLAKGLIK